MYFFSVDGVLRGIKWLMLVVSRCGFRGWNLVEAKLISLSVAGLWLERQVLWFADDFGVASLSVSFGGCSGA